MPARSARVTALQSVFETFARRAVSTCGVRSQMPGKAVSLLTACPSKVSTSLADGSLSGLAPTPVGLS